jgi:hypothetical protein
MNKHYGRDALRRTQVYSWIKEVRLGKSGLSSIPSLGMAPDEGRGGCAGKALKEDLRLSMKKATKILTISFTMVRNYLTRSLGMKCYYMRWVPHMLTAAQNAKCRKIVGSTLEMPERHPASNFHFLWPGDESWIFYEDDYETM